MTLTSSDIPLMFSRVSVSEMAICTVCGPITVGVVPASRASVLVKWWYRTCMFKATLNMFFSLFDPVDPSMFLRPAPTPYSEVLLYLKKSSFTLVFNVYFTGGFVLCSRYIFSKISVRDFTANWSRRLLCPAINSRSA